MGMEIPDELANLFYGLTGTKWPKVDEDRLRDFSDAYATVEYILATELPELVLVLRRKVRSTFDSHTTEYFENSLAQFTAGERNYLGEAAELAGEIHQYAKDAANQVEYAKWMIIGQLIQLTLEIAWAIATAKFTFGASLKMIPLFKFIKSQLIRRILNWLVWNLLSHLFIAQLFGVTMDLLIQRIQMGQGNRGEWDKELTRMAAAGAFVEGLLSAGLSFGADLFLSGQLAKLFGKNLPDPPAPPPPTTRDIIPDPPTGPPGRDAGPDPIAAPPPRDTPDTSTAPPRDPPGGGPTPPPRDPPGGGPDIPPDRVPTPPGSITPEFNRDLVNLFARNSNEFLNAAQKPNTASVGMDHARRFVDGSGDMFARHFGGTVGDAAARNLGRDYAETLLRTWNTPRMTSSLDDVLGSAPLPQTTRDHLARDVPDAFGRTVTDFGNRWQDRATALGIGAASGAFEGYMGEGLTNLWFSPEQEWKASGMSAVAGASSSVVHDLAVSGGLKGIDSLSDLRDLNDRPAPDLDGAGGDPSPGARGPVTADDASSVPSDWETPPQQDGNRSFASQDEPVSRLRGGGESTSSFESYGGDGDDVSTIAPSNRPGGEDGGDGEGGEHPSLIREEHEEPSPGGEGPAAGPGGDENPGQRGPDASQAGPGSDPGGRGGERSAQTPRENQDRSGEGTPTIAPPTDPGHAGSHGNDSGAPVSPPPEDGSPDGESRGTGPGSDVEGGFPRPSPDDGFGLFEPRPSEASGKGIDIGEFFRSLNGDLAGNGAEGVPQPPPVVAASAPPPAGPASPSSSSSAPGASASGRPEGAGSGPSRDGVHEAAHRGVSESPANEDVPAPSDPPVVAAGPPDTETMGTSRDAEHASDEVSAPRTESTPAPPVPEPVAPVAEPPLSGGERPRENGSDPSAPPTGEGRDPVTPNREEQGEGDVESSPAKPEDELTEQTEHDEAAATNLIEETGGEKEEGPPTDGIDGGAAVGKDDAKTPVAGSGAPLSGEPAESAASDTHAAGTPPPIASSRPKSDSERDAPRPPSPVRGRGSLREPEAREKGPFPPTDPGIEEPSGTTDFTEGSGPVVPRTTESEPSETEEPPVGEPKGKEPEREGPGPRAPEGKKSEPDPTRDPAEETGFEETEAAETVTGQSKGKARATEETGSENSEPPSPPRTNRAPERPVRPVRPPMWRPGGGPPAVAGPSGTRREDTSRTEEGTDGLRLNYLIESRWIESYGVRVAPDSVLDTFPELPDDVRVFLGQDLATDPRDFFSPSGVRRTSSDGRTYTLRLSSENAWRSGGQDRPGATTAKYKGLHDEQTQRSSSGSGLSGKARRPIVSVQANLFGVDAIPAPVVGGRVSAFGGSAVQQQSGGTNHTQLLTTEMTGAGKAYNSDLTVAWQVEGGPSPAQATPEASGGTGPDTSGNPPPETTPTTGGGGTARPGPRPPLLTRIPQGVELVLMGGLRPHRDDLPQEITFSDLWAPPTTPPANGTGNGAGTGDTGTANTGTGDNTTGRTDTDTKRNDRRYGGYLANSHPIAIDSITRRTTDTPRTTDASNASDTPGSEGRGTSRPEEDTRPTTMNSWIADRLGFEPPAAASNTRRVLHRTRGNSEAPAVVSQPKSGSRAQHRELNRLGVLEVFSDDIIMTQLPTMTSEPRTVSVPDAKGGSRLITLWSQPVSMELVPDTPNNFNIKMTDRLTRGSGQLANRLKGFFAAVSAGIVSRLPGDMVRLEAPSFETRFQKVWTRGRGRSDNAWDSHLFHSTDTAVYNTRRTIAVWFDNDTGPALFDVSATEALTVDDVRRLSGGRPDTERITQTGDPFLDRAEGPTHLGDSLVRDVTHADGTEIRTPDGGPARTFFRDYAYQLLTQIDRQYPGLVLPHLALPGTPEPKRSHAGWNHRRNRTQARENTVILLSKVNAVAFRSDPDAWLSEQVEVKLVETKFLPWLNEFRERRLRVHDHISVWPRARITGYSEATPLPNSHTGTTTGASSNLSRQAGKITSGTAEGRFGVTVRNADQGLDAFGNTSEAGGVTGRATSEFRKRQRSEHGVSSTTETNVKDKSGSRRLFADAHFSAWFGPKDGLVPRSSRSEAVSSTGMGREIFVNGSGGVPPLRAQVELHAPRVGRRVPLDAPPAGDPAPPRKLPSSEAFSLFGQGPAGFVTTAPRSPQVMHPNPDRLETITETPESPQPSPQPSPQVSQGRPPGTQGVNPPPAAAESPPLATTGNPPGSHGSDPTGATTGTAPPTTTSGNPPRTTSEDNTVSRAPSTTSTGPPPLAIQRTPRAEQLSQTFGTVQAFNPAVSRRGEHVITVGSLTYEALDRNHWSFSRSVASREGVSDIIAAHTSSQTLAASPGLMQSTGDRLRVQLDDGIAPQRTRPTTVTWYVPTHVVSAALREFAVLESNQAREISFSSGLSYETTFTVSVAARGSFNPQPTAETPGQAPRGTVGPIVQPGLEARYMPYGHGRGESSSVSYRTRREVKFTGATFEFITNGVILQATEHKKDFDFLFSIPRSTKESSYTAWHVPVKNTQKMLVPALWVFSKGLVHDRLVWRDNGEFELGSHPPPHAPPAGLGTKPDLAGKGFDSGPIQVASLVDDLVQEIKRDGWELTVHSREDLIREVSEHVNGNRSGLEVRVKPTETRMNPHDQGVLIKDRSRTATIAFDVRRGPASVPQLGGQMEYVDRNIKTTVQNRANTKFRGHGTGAAMDLLSPIGNREDPGTGRQVGAVNAGGSPAFRQQSVTEQSSLQGKEREETQERVLFSPYARVITPTHVTARLSIGDQVYTARADDNRQESVYPLPYLETATPEDSPRPEPQYEPSSIGLDGSSYVDTWVAGRKGPNGTGYQDGDGGLDAIPLAIEGEAKHLLDAAVVNTALVNGWTSPNSGSDFDAASVASATRYLDDRISDIDQAAGITARKDELLLLSLTPEATREPTVLGEFKGSVVKVRALLNTGAATIEGVSNDSRARDSDQEGGRQSQVTAEQKTSNLGVGGQVTETAGPQDRVRESGETENVALSGARGGNSAGQRHGAVAKGPGTKRMFLVRVPAVWAVWAESADSKVPVRGGQANASVLRWVDANQARSWGLDTDSPAIERYVQAAAEFATVDAAYFRTRGELFSFVGQINEPGTSGTRLRERDQELVTAYSKEEGVRDSAMRDLVDAMRELRGERPQAVTAPSPVPGTETGTEAEHHSVHGDEETQTATDGDPVGAPPDPTASTTDPTAAAEEPGAGAETGGEGRSRQEELNAEFDDILNVPPSV